MFSQVHKKIKLNGTIEVRSMMFSEIKTWNREKMSWKKQREADLLEQIPLLGHPKSEKERLASWLRLLRRARVAIRRLQRNLRHLPREALVQMLRAARAPQDCISMRPRPFDFRDATTRSRDLKHTKCHHLDPLRSITKWESMCSRSLTQSANFFSILNAVCMGTTYDQAWIVRGSETLGSPSSHACLRAFVHSWTRWAGWLRVFRCDRETHNRGVFSSVLAKNGVMIRLAGLQKHQNKSAELSDEVHVQEDDVKSHQRHARIRQKIDGHDTQ